VVALGGVQARFRVRAGWGRRLPVQQTFTLGGSDGFAGLRLGDVRGSQEAYAALQLKRRVAPQLSLTAEGMTGAIGTGYGFLVRRDSTDFGKLFAGVRLGFEATTPIGPIRVEEGINHAGTRALLVRVGYWF
jgi:outer membrane protein assembly factor BamA